VFLGRGLIPDRDFRVDPCFFQRKKQEKK